MATHLEYSRAYPVAPEEAFQRTLVVPLEQILGRRYLAIAGITGTEPAAGSHPTWGADGVGQQRTIRFSDGASARETLTTYDAPHAFGYRLGDFTGLLRPMLGDVAGRWAFAPAGTGTRITWSWDVTPANPAARLAMPALDRLWHGVARQAFDALETHLAPA